MSTYHHVFLAPIGSTSEEKLAAQLGEDLGLRFDRQPSDYADYVATEDDVALDLGTHDFESDRDMAFDEFPYVITVRRIGTDVGSQQTRARRVFDRLRDGNRYKLMLTEDLQRRLAEYEPDPEDGRRGSVAGAQ